MAYLGILLTISGALLLSLMSPGPNFIIVTSTAMTISRKGGVLIGLGLAAASCAWTLLAVGGLALIVTNGGWLYFAIKLVGAIYLIVLGVKMVFGARKPLPQPLGVQGGGGPAAMRKGCKHDQPEIGGLLRQRLCFACSGPCANLVLCGNCDYFHQLISAMVLRLGSRILARTCSTSFRAL